MQETSRLVSQKINNHDSHHLVVTNDLNGRLLVGTCRISYPDDSAEDTLTSETEHRVPLIQHFTNPHSWT